jgi:hypothetical protein
VDVSRDVSKVKKILSRRFSSQPLTIRCYSEAEAGLIREQLSPEERERVAFNWLEAKESFLLEPWLGAPYAGQAVLA